MMIRELEEWIEFHQVMRDCTGLFYVSMSLCHKEFIWVNQTCSSQKGEKNPQDVLTDLKCDSLRWVLFTQDDPLDPSSSADVKTVCICSHNHHHWHSVIHYSFKCNWNNKLHENLRLNRVSFLIHQTLRFTCAISRHGHWEVKYVEHVGRRWAVQLNIMRLPLKTKCVTQTCAGQHAITAHNCFIQPPLYTSVSITEDLSKYGFKTTHTHQLNTDMKETLMIFI